MRLYFDQKTGLLVRMVRYADTPVGRNPTEIDYADYRDADGVKIPFRWTLARGQARSEHCCLPRLLLIPTRILSIPPSPDRTRMSPGPTPCHRSIPRSNIENGYIFSAINIWKKSCLTLGRRCNKRF